MKKKKSRRAKGAGKRKAAKRGEALRGEASRGAGRGKARARGERDSATPSEPGRGTQSPTPGLSVRERVESAVAALRRLANRKTREEMGPRYGIVASSALGVPVAKIRQVARACGRDHELAAALWETEIYEARMLAAFVDEPARVTPAQMDAWCRDFDNWAICDTVCFHLFDRTKHAMSKAAKWAGRREEFVRRGAFALLASVALHNKAVTDEELARALPLLEEGAKDGRNFVKKAVSWALRAIGGRRKALRAEVVEMAERLAASTEAAARWVGRDVLRGLKR